MITSKECLFGSIEHAKEVDYSSHDMSDLLQTLYYAKTAKLPNGLIKKVLQEPYKRVVKLNPKIIRKFASVNKQKYAQGHAMMIRAFTKLVKKKHPLGDLDEAIKLAEWLIKNRSEYSSHYGWGQPFLWYSRKEFPPNIPRATVSSQVGWAFLDLYEITKEEKYLEIAKDICYLFKNEFNYQPDANGNFCLSYTTIDHYHIHNASMLAASVIFKVASIIESDELLEFGTKLVNFTIGHQNDDGSFYYWAPPDKLNFMIDNYHTGFVLESLYCVNQVANNPVYQKAFSSGMQFYVTNLFEYEVPLLSTKNKYPIDIQSCAQSILTFSLAGLDDVYIQKAHEVADYCVENFYMSEKRHFAYRIYKDGSVDESFYFRWGDSWMIRALASLI